MALTVVWEKVAVDEPVERDKDGNVTAVTARVLKRGENLPDYVGDFVRATLVMIGAVRDLGLAVEAVQSATDQAFATPPAPSALSAEVPPPDFTTGSGGAVRVDVNAETGEVATSTTGDVTAGAEMVAAPVKPSTSDNKEAWETYAVAMGYLTETEAQSMTKTKLVTEVNARESA